MMQQLARHALLPYLLALLACVLLLPALWAGFQLDDHFQCHALLGLGDPAISLSNVSCQRYDEARIDGAGLNA